jgi:putative PIN family toxin of toxin-antitoxin system
MLSGLLWRGPPRQCILAAELKKIKLCGTEKTYKEFCRVVSYQRFTAKLNSLHFSRQRLAIDYLKLVSILPEPELLQEPIVEADPDDDIFVYAAIAAEARVIVSGDIHLLSLGQFRRIHILSPAELVKLIDLTDRPVQSLADRFPRHPRLLRS